MLPWRGSAPVVLRCQPHADDIPDRCTATKLSKCIDSRRFNDSNRVNWPCTIGSRPLQAPTRLLLRAPGRTIGTTLVAHWATVNLLVRMTWTCAMHLNNLPRYRTWISLRRKLIRQLRKRKLARLTVVGVALSVMLVLGDRIGEQFASAGTAPLIRLRPANSLKPISLRDRLLVGLEARIPSEVVFVDLVVHLVNTGKVPQRVVDQTFFWARDRAARVQGGNPRRAIIYFRPAMIARLERLGIETH